MGNLISRPSCLGQKSKQVKSEELDQPKHRKEHLPKKEPQEANTPATQSPILERPQSTSLPFTRPDTPSPAKTPLNGTLTKGSGTGLRRAPQGQQVKGIEETPLVFQRRNSGSPWPWRTLSSREVTEVTEVTETIVTEIVEVTEFPSGDKGGDPVVTRTVRVLTGAAEELTELRSDGHSSSDQESSVDRWTSLNKKSLRALAAKDAFEDSETFHRALEALLTWVSEIEELIANQKPPSSEVKVLKAQLQEQKLLQRLLEDRRPSVESMVKQGPQLAKAFQSAGRESAASQICSLQEKWKALLQHAESRRGGLEQILPRAQRFQETTDTFQHWLMAAEQSLSELRSAERGMGRIPEAAARAKAAIEEIKSKGADLEDVRQRGHELMEKISEEESQLVQEKADSLRIRYSVLSLSGADVLQRLEQALEASQRCTSSQEELHLWLGRIERELLGVGSQPPPGEGVLCATERLRLEQAVEKELAWFEDTGRKLEELSNISLHPDVICSQLYDQKILAVEIMQHRFNIEKMMKVLEILQSYSEEGENENLQSQLDTLQEKCQAVSTTRSHEVLQLEHAQALLLQFSESYAEVSPWLQETQDLVSQLSLEATSYEAFREQQERLQGLRESIAEHKPLISRLCSVSRRLSELSPTQGEEFCQRAADVAERHRAIRDRVRELAGLLEESLPRYTQLSERMSLLGESLERLRSRLQSPVALRGQTSRIQEQLQESQLTLAELGKMGQGLGKIEGQACELLASAKPTGDSAICVAIQEQVSDLGKRLQEVQAQAQERDKWLLQLLDLAAKFWGDVNDLTGMLNDTQQAILDVNGNGSDPVTIQQSLENMQALRDDIDSLQGDLDSLGILGMDLMSACGDIDKPDVTKCLDELYGTWNNLSKLWTECHSKLENYQQVALLYQDTMQGLFEWLKSAELKSTEEFLVETDLEAVKQQLCDLKAFKRELYQKKIEMESLNHRFVCRLPLDHETPGSTSSLENFRRRWDGLEGETVSRQHQLECALLGLGQFQNTLDELHTWLSHTADLLQGPRPISIDLQICEIELAKHKVLRNDVMSHVRTVESLNRVGRELLEAGSGDSPHGLQAKLEQLDERWEYVRCETERRQLELENNLSQVQDVTMEIQDLLQWLENTELRMSSSRLVWGLPETANERLSAHLELCKEMESKRQTYDNVSDTIHRLLENHDVARGSSTEHSLCILEQKWETVYSKVQERKAKLTEGLSLAKEFHSTVQDLLTKMAQCEEAISALQTPSFLLDTVCAQLQDHRTLVSEVQAYSEKKATVESAALRLKELSRKEEGNVVQNLVMTVQTRYEKLQQRVGERAASLEEVKKQAKQFNESWRLLVDWMVEVEQTLDTHKEIAVSHEEIKQQLTEQKEFQKLLRLKRPMYEATLKRGRALLEKSQSPEDRQQLADLVSELRDSWDTINGKSMERQHKLEEALLFSGRFTDALQALMDWLFRAEPQLAEDMPVGGEKDLVNNLIDKHKVFQKELGKRAGCIKTLKRSVRDLTKSSMADSRWLLEQMEELDGRWETICKLSVSKQARLEDTLRQAEEFDRLVHSFLERLSDVERTLKYGPIPEEEEALLVFHKQHQESMNSLQCQEMELDSIRALGEEILSACHPDSVITIKSWISVTKTRLEEVQAWAQQQGERLRSGLSALEAEREEVQRLLDWISSAEESLALRDQEGLPESMESTEELIAQHEVFMDELNGKVPEVESAIKSCKMKMVPKQLMSPSRKTPTKRKGSQKLQPPTTLPLENLEPQNPKLCQLVSHWKQLWLVALARQSRLLEHQQKLREMEAFASFDFEVWRKRYTQWISHLKSRILDVFRGIDKDQDGRITQKAFINSVLASKFPTNSLEMAAVANIFDINGDGYIDYYEFVSTLHPSRDPYRRTLDADQINEEVSRQVSQCNCPKRFQVEQISANRYRFGDSQQLRMVRILRSTLMVRVGGGWTALDEFLVKNDPCRVKGRTNLKIKEKYLTSSSFSTSRKGNSTSKPLGVSRSNSSLSLYSTASAPSSPLTRKSVLRRSLSGDRCSRPRSSIAALGPELQFASPGDDGSPSPPVGSDEAERPPT
ncbi:microtubule-actin cross-linking factor 1, isoforms 6/7 isoform X1 [Paramormyrops kingsleyae]|uniref:microtubule-actin cross-linking factor 1, isoforms 6/7 isoform X1 n=1 Tax=Paramormyrops kingsleyae TaxID=1676925 RepID=UPI003B977544